MTKQRPTLVAVILLAASATGALAAPPPPPPRPPHTAPPVAEFKVCRDRYYLRYEKSSYIEIRPCTIKATAKGRFVELRPVTGPNAYEDEKGRQRRLIKVVFRSFMPGPPLSNGMMGVTQTGRTVRVRLQDRVPSPMTPYVVKLPAAICSRDYWLLSILLSDGTEMKPFGVIDSTCGPIAKSRR
jgi:hypothetical protein